MMNIAKDILFGIAVGDALGVPVEFRPRAYLKQHPLTDMVGYGTYNVPAGIFSDDSSMTFCLAEALVERFDLNLIAANFIRWYRDNFWTADGRVFDIGIGTREAIVRLSNGVRPELAGGVDEYSNGNGSLMRILPLLFELENTTIEERFQKVKSVSSITHRHVRSAIGCFIYLEFALKIKNGISMWDAYSQIQKEVSSFLEAGEILPSEIKLFERVLVCDISTFHEDDIRSGGYVIDTLEACLWALLTTDSYEEAVLKAINLGDDTDTTGAVTGGLAGILYGFELIPAAWLQKLARKDDIEKLANSLMEKYHKK